MGRWRAEALESQSLAESVAGDAADAQAAREVAHRRAAQLAAEAARADAAEAALRAARKQHAAEVETLQVAAVDAELGAARDLRPLLGRLPAIEAARGVAPAVRAVLAAKPVALYGFFTVRNGYRVTNLYSKRTVPFTPRSRRPWRPWGR